MTSPTDPSSFSFLLSEPTPTSLAMLSIPSLLNVASNNLSICILALSILLVLPLTIGSFPPSSGSSPSREASSSFLPSLPSSFLPAIPLRPLHSLQLPRRTFPKPLVLGKHGYDGRVRLFFLSFLAQLRQLSLTLPSLLFRPS